MNSSGQSPSPQVEAKDRDSRILELAQEIVALIRNSEAVESNFHKEALAVAAALLPTGSHIRINATSNEPSPEKTRRLA